MFQCTKCLKRASCVSVCAGFPLNEQLYKMIVRRYSDEQENMDFDNFIGCLVRLDAMCRECRRAGSRLLAQRSPVLNVCRLFVQEPLRLWTRTTAAPSSWTSKR